VATRFPQEAKKAEAPLTFEGPPVLQAVAATYPQYPPMEAVTME
jgi:hypothetical protein